MFALAHNQQGYFFIGLILTSYLGTAHGRPLQNDLRGVDVVRDKLIARQATTIAHPTIIPSAPSSAHASSTWTSLSATRTTISTSSTSTTSTSSRRTSRIATASQTSNSTSPSTISASSSTSTASSTTASATPTASSSSSIFSKSSPYFGYAIGVLVVICVVGLLLLVLFIRFLVQKFSKKPSPRPVTSNARAWRYSQDSELFSPGTAHNSVSTAGTSSTRHKYIGSEMGERQGFLSTESVTLYPAVKSGEEPDRYSDEDPDQRRHSRSLSNASRSTATPYVSRRPASMSFLHSPPATHPAFVVDRESRSDHHSEDHELAPVQEEAGERQRSMPSLLLARAGHSTPYKEPTDASSTMLSLAPSTASVYSQPSGIHTPPISTLTSSHAQPSRMILPDVSAALSTMQTNPSTVTMYDDGLAATAPPSDDGHAHPGAQQATLRPTPGRMGWGTRAPTSTHNNSELFFDHTR